MSGHEWTHESDQAGLADASMTPDGPDQTSDDGSPVVVRSRRFPRVSFDLSGLSLNRFRLKPRPEPAADVDVDAPAIESSGDEPPRRRPRRIDWSRLPMASTKRETRVGVAALASFLILVIALIFNHQSQRGAVPMKIAGDSATKVDKDSPEATAKKQKDATKAGASPAPSPATEVTARDAKEETPPRRTEPIERASHDRLTKPQDPNPAVTKSDQQPPANQPSVAVKKPDEKTIPPEPAKAAIVVPPDMDLPPLANTAIATPAGPDAKVKTEASLPPRVTPPGDTAKAAVTPPLSAPSQPTVDLPPMVGIEPLANPGPAAPNDLPPSKTNDLAAPPSLPAAAPAPVAKKDADPKGAPSAPAQDPFAGIVGGTPEPKTAPPTNPPPSTPNKPTDELPAVVALPSTPAPAAELPSIAVPPGTLKPLHEKPLRTEPPSEPVRTQSQPPPAPPAENLSQPPADPGPRPAQMPTLSPAPVPAEVEPPAASTVSPGSRTIPTLGKFRPAETGSETRLTGDETRVADAPSRREPVGAREQVDPILHTVQRGENFWTISKSYYGSGRYYRALHAANVKLVPVISELYVGSTIKVPPIENLDRALFDPPSRSSVAEGASTRDTQVAASARTPRPDDGRAVPSRPRVDVELGMPTVRPKRAGVRDELDEPTRPTYRVRTYDTLRSIARDTLGDSHRYREILDLNRDVIDDPTRLVSGQTLTLPEDAIVRDRPR
jgi:hypothetical protein